MTVATRRSWVHSIRPSRHAVVTASLLSEASWVRNTERGIDVTQGCKSLN